MKYLAVLVWDLDQELDWEFETEQEAADFASLCLKQGYTMYLKKEEQ